MLLLPQRLNVKNAFANRPNLVVSGIRGGIHSYPTQGWPLCSRKIRDGWSMGPSRDFNLRENLDTFLGFSHIPNVCLPHAGHGASLQTIGQPTYSMHPRCDSLSIGVP